MSFKAQFTDAKENFRNSFFKQGTEYHLTDKNDILFAVESAYKTAQRTFTNISKIDKGNNKRNIFESFAKVLKIYFTNAVPEYQSDEDGWKEFSNQLKEWRDIITSGFKNEVKYVITVGQAQKIVNITFKYLYCFDDASKHEEHFKYCHMVLDSFTLEWYRQEFNKCKNAIPTWSKITEIEYDNIQNEIHEKLKEKGMFECIYLNESSFKSEFVIWPYMIAKSNLDSIIKSFRMVKISNWKEIKRDYIPVLKDTKIDKKELDNIMSNLTQTRDWMEGLLGEIK